MKRLLAATTLASVALFFWGFLFWTALEPALGVVDRVADEGALAADLATHLERSGTYMLPAASSAETLDSADFRARHENGPLVTVFYRREGAPAMAPGTFAAGFAHMWISVFLMALLLRWIARYLGSFRQRAGFVTWVGLISGVSSNLGRPIWFFQPWDYHFLETAYDITSWMGVGLILAWFLHGDT